MASSPIWKAPITARTRAPSEAFHFRAPCPRRSASSPPAACAAWRSPASHMLDHGAEVVRRHRRRSRPRRHRLCRGRGGRERRRRPALFAAGVTDHRSSSRPTRCRNCRRPGDARHALHRHRGAWGRRRLPPPSPVCARGGRDLLVLSLHWGRTCGSPRRNATAASPARRSARGSTSCTATRLSHPGRGALQRGLILYDTGNFIDDYWKFPFPARRLVVRLRGVALAGRAARSALTRCGCARAGARDDGAQAPGAACKMIEGLRRPRAHLDDPGRHAPARLNAGRAGSGGA